MICIFTIIIIWIQMVTIDSKSNADLCTKGGDDPDVNRILSVFTIQDKVYLRFGSTESRYYVYDVNRNQIEDNPISIRQLFPSSDFKVIERVCFIDCPHCPSDVENLVIVIGRKDMQSYRGFETFRRHTDGSVHRIQDKKELPINWLLLSGSGEFSIDAPRFEGFFMEALATPENNMTNIHGFAFIPSAQVIHLNHWSRENNQDIRHFLYRKLSPMGQLTAWEEARFGGVPILVLNSLFNIKDKVYTLDNNVQYMPRIAHNITIAVEADGVLRFDLASVDVDVRVFFNCYDNFSTTPTPLTPPTTSSLSPSAPSNPLSPSVSSLPLTTVASITSSEAVTQPPSAIASVTSPAVSTDTTIHTTSTTTSTTTNLIVQTTVTSSQTPAVTNISETSDPSVPFTTLAATAASSPSVSPTTLSTTAKPKSPIVWISLLLLIILLLVILICCVSGYMYWRNKQKEAEKPGGQEAGGGAGGLTLTSTASSTSLRSNQNLANRGDGTAEAGTGTSTTSMRSLNDKQGITPAKGDPSMASTASLRTQR